MDTISNKTVTTRKPHFCWGCGRTFPARSQMRVTVTADGGAVDLAYWCEVCDEVMRSLDPYDLEEGFGLGDVKAEYPDEWTECYARWEASR